MIRTKPISRPVHTLTNTYRHAKRIPCRHAHALTRIRIFRTPVFNTNKIRTFSERIFLTGRRFSGRRTRSHNEIYIRWYVLQSVDFVGLYKRHFILPVRSVCADHVCRAWGCRNAHSKSKITDSEEMAATFSHAHTFRHRAFTYFDMADVCIENDTSC